MRLHLIKYGFIAAGLMNIGGVLLFSKGLTNSALNQADPVVMSNFGLWMIMVWGLVFIAAAHVYTQSKWLAAAFFVEKLSYVVVWVHWLMHNRLADLYAIDMFAGIFYTIYGLNDAVFMLFFMLVFLNRQPARI